MAGLVRWNIAAWGLGCNWNLAIYWNKHSACLECEKWHRTAPVPRLHTISASGKERNGTRSCWGFCQQNLTGDHILMSMLKIQKPAKLLCKAELCQSGSHYLFICLSLLLVCLLIYWCICWCVGLFVVSTVCVLLVCFFLPMCIDVWPRVYWPNFCHKAWPRNASWRWHVVIHVSPWQKPSYL